MQLPTEEAEAYTNVADSFTDGEHVHVQTYEGTHARRIARAATHPGPASPPFSHIRYVLHQIFHLLSARLNTLAIIVMLFTNIIIFVHSHVKSRLLNIYLGLFWCSTLFLTVWYFWLLLTQVKVDYWRSAYLRFFCQLPHMPGGSHPCLLGLQSVVDWPPDTSLSSAILHKIIKFQFYSIQHTPDCIALVGSFQLLHKANQLYKLSSVPILRLLPISDW